MSLSIADIRSEYTLRTLDERNVLANPTDQFNAWFSEAIAASVNEPNAMHLATVDRNFQPNGRIVLLKGCDTNGFTFFTNYTSTKGKELLACPLASLTFFWPELERQVRIQGKTELLDAGSSDAYFQSRPRASQLGAWTSNQSQVVESREQLEQKQAELEKEFAGKVVTRPPYWGGILLRPHRVEFWQGRPGRLHDRIVYLQEASGDSWQIARLSP